MTRVEVTVTIERPPEEVFACIADFEKNSLWQAGVQKAWFTSNGPFGVGSTYTQLSRFLGRDIEFHFEIDSGESEIEKDFVLDQTGEVTYQHRPI